MIFLPLFVWLGAHSHDQRNQAKTDVQIRQYEAETHRMEGEAQYHVHPSPTRPAEAHRKMQETVDGNGASSDPEAGNSLSKFEKLSDLCLFGRDTLVGLEKLRTRLLDLTRNNRLLNFKYTDCLKHKC
jgi:hypothetical protein